MPLPWLFISWNRLSMNVKIMKTKRNFLIEFWIHEYFMSPWMWMKEGRETQQIEKFNGNLLHKERKFKIFVTVKLIFMIFLIFNKILNVKLRNFYFIIWQSWGWIDVDLMKCLWSICCCWLGLKLKVKDLR